MDIKQDEIATMHDLCVDNKKLIRAVNDAVIDRPVSIVMPMLYREIKNDALENIVKGLNKCTYVSEVVIPLAAKNEKEFLHVKRFFRDLKTPKLIMWCNGPRIDKLLNELKPQGINVLKSRGKGRDVWLALGIASIRSYAIALQGSNFQFLTLDRFHKGELLSLLSEQF